MSREQSLRWVMTLPMLLLTPIAFGADDQQQEALRQRLIVEAIPGWEKVKASMLSISGSATRTYWYRTSDPKDEEFGHDYFVRDTGTFWLTGGAGRFVFDRYDKSEKWAGGWVYCFNPDYAFIQSKSVQSEAYVTKEFGQDASVSNSVKLHLDRVNWATIPYNGYIASDISLIELVKSERCRIRAWDDVLRDGQKLVEVRLEYPAPPAAMNWDPSNRLTLLTLDPQKDWRVVSNQTISVKVSTDLNVTYDPNGPETGRISKVEFVVHEPNRNLDNLETVEFPSLSYASIPIDDLFYLPEHPRSKPAAEVVRKSNKELGAPMANAVWFSAANIIYIVIAILLAALCWWTVRRRSSQA